jgi:hypothetical protein
MSDSVLRRRLAELAGGRKLCIPVETEFLVKLAQRVRNFRDPAEFGRK